MELKKIFAICAIFLFFSISISSAVCCIDLEKIKEIIETTEGNEELDLLRAEHDLYLEATENVGSFNVKYAFPPEYKHQYPIFMEILSDSDANITNYNIENDFFEPNKVVNFSIGPMKKGDIKHIHFYYWVLVNNYNYSDFPKNIKIPKEDELPIKTLNWLSPSEVVQSNQLLIKLRARLLKPINNNLVKLADRIAKFVRWHRYFFFLFQYTFGRYKSQDAFTTLLRNGECPGRSHLGCALFRANGVPARVLLATPVTYDFWFEMHYMTEYYCPEFGWILTEVHGAKTPFEQKYQIIHRICYPEDEADTQADFIFPKMKGLEHWIWVDNENVKPYYKDLKEGSSRSRAYAENEVFTAEIVKDDVIALTQDIFYNFSYFLDINLEGENLVYFENAVEYQKEAVKEFASSVDPFGYIYYMVKASVEYEKIIL